MTVQGVASMLLLIIGILGAVDIFLFHMRQQSLRQQPSARQELITHSLRGPTYALLFLLVPNFAAQGAWFACMLAILAFDLGISIWDFSLEARSRAPMGGLPTGEYVLHSLIAVLFGAFVACYCIGGADGWGQDSALVYRPNVPLAVQLVLALMAGGVLLSGILDARAVVRLGRASR